MKSYRHTKQYYIDKYKPKFNYKGINTPFC